MAELWISRITATLEMVYACAPMLSALQHLNREESLLEFTETNPQEIAQRSWGGADIRKRSTGQRLCSIEEFELGWCWECGVVTVMGEGEVGELVRGMSLAPMREILCRRICKRFLRQRDTSTSILNKLIPDY